MEAVNAFINHPQQPTTKELSAALGACADVWNALVGTVTHELGASVEEWKSYSPKAGWSLRLKQKKRTILYMSPAKDCFQVALILGDRALAAARQLRFPKAVAHAIETAPKYPEGTGVRLRVKRMADLTSIRKLAEVKIAN